MNQLERLYSKHCLTINDLKKFIEILPKKQTIIVEMRYGLGDLTSIQLLREIANHFNCSSQCINIMENTALRRIKRFKELYSKIKGDDR